MTIDDETITQFAAIFAGRDDVAGRLTATGKGWQEKAPVTRESYQAHLEGRRYPASSLGIYPLTDDGMVVWGAADMDLGDEASAWAVVDKLATYGARAYVEVSKSKGHHVWVFFTSPTPAYAVRRLLKRATMEAGVACEIFPKQDNTSAETPFGNYLHLPYYGHPDAAGGRYFITRDGRALGVREFLDRLEASTVPPWARLRPPVAAVAQDRLTRGAYTGRRAACIEAVLQGSVREGYRNEALVRVAGYLVNTEHAPDAESLTLDAARRWGLSDAEARATYASAQERGIWYGCDRKREIPEMAAACIWEACPFHRSPTRVANGPRFTIARAADLPAPPPVAPVEVDPFAEQQLIELLAPCGFLRHYLDYCTPLSDAPPMGHLAAALILVATALGNRVWMRSFGGNVLRPNMWIVFLAPSGARKSSIMTKAVSFLMRLKGGEDLLLSSKASIEQWFVELAANPARLLHADEFLGLYRRFERDIMAEARSDLTALFATSRMVYSTKKDGTIVINNPALSLLAGCTPDELERSVRREHFAAGFLARILWLPARWEAPAPARIPQIELAKEEALLERLQWITTLSGEITFGDDINERLATWANEFRQTRRDDAGEGIGLVNRAFDFAAKFAMVLQVAETEPGAGLWRDLDPDVVERAIRLTEWVIDSALRFIKTDLADSDYERAQRDVMAKISAAGGRMTRGNLRRAIRSLKGREFMEVMDHLLEAGELMAVTDDATRPPTTYYQLNVSALPSTSRHFPSHREVQNPHPNQENRGALPTSRVLPLYARKAKNSGD